MERHRSTSERLREARRLLRAVQSDGALVAGEAMDAADAGVATSEWEAAASMESVIPTRDRLESLLQGDGAVLKPIALVWAASALLNLAAPGMSDEASTLGYEAMAVTVAECQSVSEVLDCLNGFVCAAVIGLKRLSEMAETATAAEAEAAQTEEAQAAEEVSDHGA